MADPPPPSAPRWVKVSGTIAIVLVLVAALMMFIVGGEHGPGRHTASDDDPGRQTLPSGATGGVPQP